MINDENIIIEEIKYFIKSNQIKEQEKLPSERNLSELFTVSRFSLRKALKHLVDTGYLYVKAVIIIKGIELKFKSPISLLYLKKINRNAD